MYWLNGKLFTTDQITLSVTDPAFIFGATIFTTIRVYHHSLDHPLTQWENHLQRLKAGLKALDWSEPNWDRIREGALQVLPHHPVLRITLFSDGRELIIGRNFPLNLAQNQKEGIVGYVTHNPLLQRSLASYKTGNYLTAWTALQQANDYNAQEAILCDTHGQWLETSTGNLWGYKEGKWFTPPLGSILPGVMRNYLLDYFKKQSIEIVEKPWDRDFYQDLDILAYSNCVVQFIPFKQIINDDSVRDFNLTHDCLREIQLYFSHF